jgi:predicted glycosyltransferase
LRLFNVVRAYNPDLFIGESAIAASHISYLMHKNCITFEDTEHAIEQIMLYRPFVSTILTPSCFRRPLGDKQIMYDGYKELAYLHPNRFRPDPSVLDELGISRDERIIVLRFVSWRATHDMGHFGIKNRKTLVKMLEEHAHVLITSEGPLEKELQKYRIRSSPEKIHTILYYSHLYLGEGATMATESALLGTPSIYISSLAGSMGNFAELESRYDLLYEFASEEQAIGKAISLLSRPNLKQEWRQKVERLLKEKIDLTGFMVWFTENYPESLYDLKEEAHLQDQFKYCQ